MIVSSQVRTGVNTDRVTRALLAKLDSFPLPTGYRIEAAGEIASREESFGGLGAAIFIATFGILAIFVLEIKNSILLVDFTNQLREGGTALREAIERAGKIRFVPIVLTSATAIGGLISSTLLSRLVTPVLYELLPPMPGTRARRPNTRVLAFRGRRGQYHCVKLTVVCVLVLATSHVLPAQSGAVADSAKAAAANTRGLAYLSEARYDSALVNLRQALVIRRALDDSAGLGRTLNSIGAAHYQMGQYDVALDAFLEALALRRAEGDQQGVARVLVNIGKIYHDWRQVDEAAQVLEEARAVADSSGHPFVLGYALNALGDLQAEVGEFSAARESFMGSLRAYSSHDPRMDPTDSTTGWWLNTGSLARLLIREGRAAEALPLLEALTDAARRITSLRAEARAYLYLAEAHHALGDRRAAIAAAEHSLALSRQLSQRVFALAALSQLAELEREAGNAPAALGHLRAFNALRDTIFDQSTAQRIASLQARIEAGRLRRERRAQEGLIARQRVVVALSAAVIALAVALLVMLYRFNLRLSERQRDLAAANAGLEAANAELRTALSEVRTLKGFIPICANCKRIRDDKGFWEAVETYVSDRSEAMFSHSICTKCGPELYGEAWSASQAPESEAAPESGHAGPSSPSSSSS